MTKTGWAPERQLINPTEDYELRYWSERFDVPTDEIVAAVKRVGTRVEDVARELNRHEYSDATLEGTPGGGLVDSVATDLL
jgi:Protein of unknown function (DUF3606)